MICVPFCTTGAHVFAQLIQVHSPIPPLMNCTKSAAASFEERTNGPEPVEYPTYRGWSMKRMWARLFQAKGFEDSRPVHTKKGVPTEKTYMNHSTSLGVYIIYIYVQNNNDHTHSISSTAKNSILLLCWQHILQQIQLYISNFSLYFCSLKKHVSPCFSCIPSSSLDSLKE